MRALVLVLVVMLISAAACSRPSAAGGVQLPFDRDWTLETYIAGPESRLGALAGVGVEAARGALQIRYHFDPRDPDRKQLEVMHELEGAGPRFGRTTNLVGATVAALVDVPRELLAARDDARIAGVQLFCESESKDGIKGRQYSRWLDLDRATWQGKVEFKPTLAEVQGFLDPAWRPDRVMLCGLKAALNDRAYETLRGVIQLKALTIDLPTPEAQAAQTSDMLRSIPQSSDVETLRRLPALEPPAPGAQVLQVGPALVSDSQAVGRVTVVDAPAGAGSKVWAVDISFSEYKDSAAGRTARVTYTLEHLLDLTRKKLTAWAAVGPSLRGAILRPNQVQIEVEDTDGRLLRGPASGVSDAGMSFGDDGRELASRWVRVDAAPVTGRPLPMGSVTPGFQAARVKKVHLRYQVGKSSHELRDQPYPMAGRLLVSEFRIQQDSSQDMRVEAPPARSSVSRPARERFYVGLNLPFYYYADVGLFPFGGRDIGGFSARPDKLVRHFARFRENKIDVVRFFALCDLRTGVTRDSSGKVNGLDKFALKDLDAVISASGGSVGLMPVLVDFLALDGQLERVYGGKRWKDGEASKDILDPVFRAAFIENALRPMIIRFADANRQYPGTVWAVDIFNEPENSTAITTRAEFLQLAAFIRQVRDMIRREAPQLRITLGSRDRRDLAAYWSDIGSIHQYHFYSKHEEEDGLPLRFPAEKLGLDGPIILGEVEPDRISDRLSTIYESGYDGAFFWSYSGHDGYYLNLDEVRRWVETRRR